MIKTVSLSSGGTGIYWVYSRRMPDRRPKRSNARGDIAKAMAVLVFWGVVIGTNEAVVKDRFQSVLPRLFPLSILCVIYLRAASRQAETPLGGLNHHIHVTLQRGSWNTYVRRQLTRPKVFDFLVYFDDVTN